MPTVSRKATSERAGTSARPSMTSGVDSHLHLRSGLDLGRDDSDGLVMPSATQIADFQETIWRHYDKYGRHDLPWRQPSRGQAADGKVRFDPYAIMVSELMLQQTQVGRVGPKFEAFMSRFPTAEALAAAPLGDVLDAWSGLGYNRRAKFLWQAAQTVVRDFGGKLPASQAELTQLPGIGTNTAGAILAYAFNRPAVFVETNIRSVFIHHFFADHEQVADTDIAALLRATLPAEQTYREWYWALMDYGAHLKQTQGNHARRSAAYAKQSKFEGSRRQIRGAVVRLLRAGPQTLAELRHSIDDERLPSVLNDLLAEGMIELQSKHYQLPSA